MAGKSLAFYPVMIDPAIVTSPPHVKALLRARFKDPLYVPASLYKMIIEYKKYPEKVNFILSHFTWTKWEKVCEDFFRLEVRPYEARSEFRKEILSSIEGVPWPSEVKEILIEEYSFLREHSSLLLRLRKTVNLLKKIGLPILDAGNRFYDAKRTLFERFRGIRWLLLTMISLGGLSSDPSVHYVLWLGNFLVVLTDP